MSLYDIEMELRKKEEIAAAVAAERERCAKIALDYAPIHDGATCKCAHGDECNYLQGQGYAANDIAGLISKS